MAVNSILPPFPIFTGSDGRPLDGGYIYIGRPGLEARSAPKASFWDVGQTVPTGTASGAAVRTSAGYPVRNGAAGMIYADADFSLTVTDKAGVVIYSALNKTFELANPTSVVSQILAPDGNLAAPGFAFTSEQSTGRLRSSAGVMQDSVLGVPLQQMTTAGTKFLQPAYGPGLTYLASPPPDIINGNFSTWRRSTSITANGYAADRWMMLKSGGTVTNSRQAFALGDTMGVISPSYFARLDVTGQSAVSDFAAILQRLDGARNYSGQVVTVLGWAKRNSGGGDMAVELSQNFGTGGSPSAQVNIAPARIALTSSWAPFAATFTVPSVAGKTLGTADDCLQLAFWASAGANYTARTGGLGVQTLAVDLWGIHIRRGALAAEYTDFYIPPPPQITNPACERFYETGQSRWDGFATNTAAYSSLCPFRTEKRATPTITLTSATNVSFPITVSAQLVTVTGFYEYRTANATAGGNFSSTWTADAELNSTTI